MRVQQCGVRGEGAAVWGEVLEYWVFEVTALCLAVGRTTADSLKAFSKACRW